MYECVVAHEFVRGTPYGIHIPTKNRGERRAR